MDFKPDNNLSERYIEWLKQFDPLYAKRWQHRYGSDPEAAMCEAAFWKALYEWGVRVEPNENLSSGEPSPDFLCQKNAEKFYVEVTCLHIEHVTRATCLPNKPTPYVVQDYRPLNTAIFEEVRQKTPQCANLDAPALVAVGTFHVQASQVCLQDNVEIEMLLTGDQLITGSINTATGIPVGKTFFSTKLKSAAFFKPSADSGLEKARLPVSGILVGGFGCKPPNIYGLLHPNPVRPFNRRLLGQTKFGQVRVDNGELSVEWV